MEPVAPPAHSSLAYDCNNCNRGAHEKGALILEAPVAGSRKPAEDATLTIMAAGDRELYDSSLPALEKMGKKILLLGENGHAARMKLANADSAAVIRVFRTARTSN